MPRLHLRVQLRVDLLGDRRFQRALQCLCLDGLLEAGRIDGCTEWQLIRKIKLPLISATVTINVILSVIAGLKAFDYSFIMTNGGPGKSTKTLMFQVYETAFTDMKMGRASAFSVMAFAFIILITVLMLFYLNKREVEL